MEPAPTATRRTRRGLRLVGAIGLLIVAVLVSSCFRDGTWLVHQQVQPGLYRSLGFDPESGGDVCFYGRSGPNGEELGRSFTPHQGAQYIEVRPTDHSFFTLGCQMWVAAPNQSALPGGPPIPAGMWRVGVDIQPGAYIARGGALCVWRRLDNARRDRASVIEEGFVDEGEFKVLSIDPGDGFFETHDCGPWEHIQF